MTKTNVKTSIVIPTKNDGDTLDKCLASIYSLNYPKHEFEVIIVDGHSRDNTVSIARKYGCKILFENKGTISYARDLGVKHALGEFVAFTDADCVVDKNWLKELEKCFINDKIAAVGGPNVTPPDDSDFAKCAGLVLETLSKAGARYGLSGGEVREIYHNPTCNVMYRKVVLDEVGGFNHNLVTVDDEELDYRIRKKGYKIMYTPYAVVYHYRRPNWRKFAKMAYQYGVGRMQAIKLHSDMGKWFHFVPSIMLICFSLLVLLSIFGYINYYLIYYILAAYVLFLLLLSVIVCSRSKLVSSSKSVVVFLLINVWLFMWAVGFIRGLFK